MRSLSSGGITDRSANPTHLGAEGTSVFGMGARVPTQVISSLIINKGGVRGDREFCEIDGVWYVWGDKGGAFEGHNCEHCVVQVDGRDQQ